MITISTGGIGPMDITANTKAKGNNKEEKATDAFASLMNMASVKQDNNFVDKSQTDVADVAPQKDVSKEYETYSKQEQIDNSEDKLLNSEKTTSKEDVETAKAKTTDEEATEEKMVLDNVVLLVKQVKETLQETLELTDQQFEDILSNMGITAAELLNDDNLKNFILQAEGATNVDLLVNENLSVFVSDLTAKVSQLVLDASFDENFDIHGLIKDNTMMLDEALKNFDTNVDIIVDDNFIAKDVVELDLFDEGVKQTDVAMDENPQGIAEGLNEQPKTVFKQNDSSSNVEKNDEYAPEKTIVAEHAELDGQPMSDDNSFEQTTNHQIQANLNQAIDDAVTANVDNTAFSGNVQEADIVRQIIDQIKVNVGKDIQSVEVQLNPENLGKVYVNVEAKDGIMQAKIVAETEAAKNAIENNLAVLKENFSVNEIKVEAIEVMVAAYGFFEESQNGDFDNQEQANDTSKSIGGINVNSVDEDALTEEEALEVEIMRTQGNTVSYTV